MLRKGPEQIPDSWLVFLLAVALMQFSSWLAAVFIDLGEDYSHLLTFLTNVLGVAMYTVVLLASGYIRRFVPIVSAIIACGAILSLFFVATYLLLNPMLGANLAVVISTLIIIWSVPVEGHIIARGIGQHWYAGIVIAMIVFTAQYAFQSTLTGRL